MVCPNGDPFGEAFGECRARRQEHEDDRDQAKRRSDAVQHCYSWAEAFSTAIAIKRFVARKTHASPMLARRARSALLIRMQNLIDQLSVLSAEENPDETREPDLSIQARSWDDAIGQMTGIKLWTGMQSDDRQLVELAEWLEGELIRLVDAED